MIQGIELELKKSVSNPDFHHIDLYQNININVYACMHSVYIYTLITIPFNHEFQWNLRNS